MKNISYDFNSGASIFQGKSKDDYNIIVIKIEHVFRDYLFYKIVLKYKVVQN